MHRTSTENELLGTRALVSTKVRFSLGCYRDVRVVTRLAPIAKVVAVH
jgi:hypothetical protein